MKQPVVCLISLGCSKNTVDSECILGNLVINGFLIAEDPSDADICLVNTCGFIQEARQETADVLKEISRYKKTGRLKAVVAMGCIPERVAKTPELEHCLDHADMRVSFNDYSRLPEICRNLVDRTIPAISQAESTDFLEFLNQPRARIGSPHSAYLKISEGCSNHCRFCSIPIIRGLQRSRSMEEIIAEAHRLIDSGAREINLIAQDTTSYGKDRYGDYRLPELLKKLEQIEGNLWIRLLYAHPRHLSDEVIELLAGAGPLCPYIDLPLQHIADPILKAMGRGMGKKETLARLDRIAELMPHGALRTTFIVGYPGETDAHFEELLELVREGRFTHLGAFTYSREPGTPAAQYENAIPPSEIARRRNALLETQLAVSRVHAKQRIGKQAEVMIDRVGSDIGFPKGTRAAARSRLEAPEVDGLIFLTGGKPKEFAPGARLNVRIQNAMDYDYIAEVTGPSGSN